MTPNHAATSFDYRIHDAFAYIVVAFEVLVGRLPYVAGAFMAQLMDGDYVDTAIAEALGYVSRDRRSDGGFLLFAVVTPLCF